MKIIEGQVFDDHLEIDSDTLVQLCEIRNGITVRGDNNTIRHNTISAPATTGVTIIGQVNTVMMNYIISFGIDGIRILDSYNAVTDNIITGSTLVNPDNHNDGIQIFPYWQNEDTEITGLNVSRNRLLLIDSDVSTQGIIATDCTVTESVFCDNLINVNHWHGLTLASGENCEISQNVIINTSDDVSRKPWIKLVVDAGGNTIAGNTTPAVIASADYPDNRVTSIIT